MLVKATIDESLTTRLITLLTSRDLRRCGFREDVRPSHRSKFISILRNSKIIKYDNSSVKHLESSGSLDVSNKKDIFIYL